MCVVLWGRDVKGEEEDRKGGGRGGKLRVYMCVCLYVILYTPHMKFMYISTLVPVAYRLPLRHMVVSIGFFAPNNKGVRTHATRNVLDSANDLAADVS